MRKNIKIIGSGFSSLAAACYLAQKGHEVTVYEKNATIGGRARQFKKEGFTFDMGPSWYWMPDVFERFYNQFGHTASDFYELKRLDPSYRVYWPDHSYTDVPASMNELEEWFESMEPGSAIQLRKFLKDAAYKYQVGMQDLVYKPSLSLLEFADRRVLGGLLNMHLLSSFSTYIRKYFKHPKILSLLEFPVLFLGAMPNETPALYSLMNYADMSLGTWYPMGGMHKFIEAFAEIAKSQGVKILTDQEVTGFETDQKLATAARTEKGLFDSDVIVSGADYEHTESKLLKDKANYSEKYWDKRTMAPSCLIFYVGINKRVENLQHHNLFFDESLEEHGKEIYKDPSWPTSPLFYLSAPSLTDPSVAPEGCENLFFLVPIAPDLKDEDEIREKYFDILVKRLKDITGNDISQNIVYKRSY